MKTKEQLEASFATRIKHASYQPCWELRADVTLQTDPLDERRAIVRPVRFESEREWAPPSSNWVHNSQSR